jgi:hypothetical protein
MRCEIWHVDHNFFRGYRESHERGVELKQLFASVIFALCWLLSIQAFPCSMAGCIGNGIEVRGNFVVRVKHEGKPLAGVTVHVAAFGDKEATDHFSTTTGTDGTARVTGLRPGNYWLDVDLLGISAVMECFHVSPHPSWRAKRKLSFDWGDMAPATRRIAGLLIDSQPGHGEGRLMNLLHRINVPISGARMRLEDPLTGKIYSAVSDKNGHFAFGSVPQGIYVLHIDSGTTPREYDSTDLLIQLSDTATRNSLLLKHSEAYLGSCGGTYLELQVPSN